VRDVILSLRHTQLAECSQGREIEKEQKNSLVSVPMRALIPSGGNMLLTSFRLPSKRLIAKLHRIEDRASTCGLGGAHLEYLPN
jgi:hypothetical protein